MRRRALSYLEILVGIGILALALLPIYDLFGQSGKSAKMTHEEILASMYCLELINQIRGMPFQYVPYLDEISLTNDENGRWLKDNEPASRIFLSAMPSNFSRYLTVEPMGDYLKKVTVSITWSSGVKRNLTHVTFLEWNP